MIPQIKRAINYILHGVRPKYITATVTVRKTDSRLEGHNIIVTGGGHGLGFSIAEKCAKEGARVIILGRDKEKLMNAASIIRNCSFLQYDVSNTKQIPLLFDECEEKLGGPITTLVNNAGISLHEGSIENVTGDTFDRQIDINLKAPYFLSKEFVRRFKMHGLSKGNILNITSERGLYCDDIPYGLIKAAMNSLTQGLGRRYINDGIRVNSIAPGVTVSDMTGYTKDGNLYRPQACGERVYLAEEIAEVAVFLLSDDSGCISSHVIPCNRGNHLKSDW